MKPKDKIYVLYRDVSCMDEAKLQDISEELPESIKLKINAKGKLKDKLLTAVSYKMLFDFLDYNKETAPDIILKNNGKPYLEGTNIYFSISHSKNIALCTLSSSEIGADIERRDKKRDYEALAKRYFTENEYKEITESENISDSFIKFWTAKESYIKYTGDGFKNGVKHFELSQKGGKLSFKDENMPKLYTFNIWNEYYLSLVTKEETPIEIINTEEVKWQTSASF